MASIVIGHLQQKQQVYRMNSRFIRQKVTGRETKKPPATLREALNERNVLQILLPAPSFAKHPRSRAAQDFFGYRRQGRRRELICVENESS